MSILARRVWQRVSLVFVALAVLAAIVWEYGPREPVGLTPASVSVPTLNGLDAWLEKREGAFDNITPGTAKQVVWLNPSTPNKTPIALVYLHGFSATSAETRPFADDLAAALGANLYFTRLTGHGRDGEALADASVQDWVNDTAEAIAVGQVIGERVVLVGTSTGGTLAAIAAADRDFGEVASVVMVSPNFRVRAAGASLLTMPFARQVVPLLVGEYRRWKPRNPEHTRYWTTAYPNVALLAMASTVAAASELSYESMSVPALFIFSDADKVVDASVTRAIADRWGAVSHINTVDVASPNDSNAHVIAGDILSPTLTASLVDAAHVWLTQTVVQKKN